MKRVFRPNITRAGRIIRGIISLLLFAGAAFAYGTSAWLALLLAVGGLFVLFEAARGWCALRACGIRTRY